MPRSTLQTPIKADAGKAPDRRALGSAMRALTLAGATVTTGLVAGLFYAYAVSVNLGLARQPDAVYVATMQAINERIQNPAFFASFFGALLFLVAALAAHYQRYRPSYARFWLVAAACVFYVGGGFLVTVFANVPLNEELASVAADASPGELAGARTAYEDPWNFWKGVRAVFSVLAFLVLVCACLLRESADPRTGGRLR